MFSTCQVRATRSSAKVQLLHSLAPSVPSCSPVPNSIAPAPRLSARKTAIECQNLYQTECWNTCPIDCQKECQSMCIYNIIYIYISHIIPDGM